MTTTDNTTAAPLTVRCVLVKVTQNTFRYAEVGPKGEVLDMRDSRVGTVYVKKNVFAGVQPQAILVTVALAE